MSSGHLSDVNMSYFQHMLGSFSYAKTSFYAGFIFLIHGLLPNHFITTGSTMISSLDTEIKNTKKNH